MMISRSSSASQKRGSNMLIFRSSSGDGLTAKLQQYVSGSSGADPHTNLKAGVTVEETTADDLANISWTTKTPRSSSSSSTCTTGDASTMSSSSLQGDNNNDNEETTPAATTSTIISVGSMLIGSPLSPNHRRGGMRKKEFLNNNNLVVVGDDDVVGATGKANACSGSDDGVEGGEGGNNGHRAEVEVEATDDLVNAIITPTATPPTATATTAIATAMASPSSPRRTLSLLSSESPVRRLFQTKSWDYTYGGGEQPATRPPPPTRNNSSTSVSSVTDIAAVTEAAWKEEKQLLLNHIKSLSNELELSNHRLHKITQDPELIDVLSNQLKSITAEHAALQSKWQTTQRLLRERDQELTAMRLESIERGGGGGGAGDGTSSSSSSSFFATNSRWDLTQKITVHAEEYHAIHAERDTAMMRAGELAHELAQARSQVDELTERLQTTNELLEQSRLEAIDCKQKGAKVEEETATKTGSNSYSNSGHDGISRGSSRLGSFSFLRAASAAAPPPSSSSSPPIAAASSTTGSSLSTVISATGGPVERMMLLSNAVRAPSRSAFSLHSAPETKTTTEGDVPTTTDGASTGTVKASNAVRAPPPSAFSLRSTKTTTEETVTTTTVDASTGPAKVPEEGSRPADCSTAGDSSSPSTTTTQDTVAIMETELKNLRRQVQSLKEEKTFCLTALMESQNELAALANRANT